MLMPWDRWRAWQDEQAAFLREADACTAGRRALFTATEACRLRDTPENRQLIRALQRLVGANNEATVLRDEAIARFFR